MMQPARIIGNALDSLVGIISPRRGIVRKQTRAAIYAAAQSPRTTGDWVPFDSSINLIVHASSLRVRARVRQLVRDFPYFHRAVKVLTDFSVGSGIVYQSAIRTKDGILDKEKIKLAEDAWNLWCEEADATGRLHLYEMMNLAKRQDLETGEFLLVKTNINKKSRYMPLALQMYESDWLTDTGSNPLIGNDVHQGIEYDPVTGRIIAYNFTDPDGWGKSIRIDASRVIHGFQTLRPGQMRGISDFAPGVLLAHDLDTYMSAEMDGAKMAAKWLAMVETPDPLSRQIGLQSDDAGHKIDSLENAIIEYLRPGEKMTLSSNPRPGSNFPPMVKLILTMLSVTTGVPYELLSGNYEGMNFSTAKMVRNDFSQHLKPVISRHVRGFCEPVKRAFFESAVLSGRLPFRDYFTNPASYLRANWQPPGMESPDIARETKSMIDQIMAGLRSPQEIAQSRGRDMEEIYREIKESQDLAESMGIKLNMGAISTAIANNPAAIDQQGAVPANDQGAQANA